MRRRFALLTVVAALAALACLGSTPALAASKSALVTKANAVLTDCQDHGQLTHTYSKAVLQEALRAMPPTVRQYSSCYDVIQGALTGAGGRAGGGGGGSGGSFLPTPVIVILVLLVLGGVTFGAVAVRRRQGAGGDQGGGGAP